MARDNVLFHASVAASTAAGTVIPLSLLYGIENVRQGYGTAVLKNVRAVYTGMYGSDTYGVPIEIKNSQWVDPAGLRAQGITNGYALDRNSLGFMRGRNKALSPNTSWTVNAILEFTANVAGDIYVLFEIEYSDVPSIANTDLVGGSPVVKKCKNASVTTAANVLAQIGTFDNLLQGVTYVLSEVSMAPTSSTGTVDPARCYFFVMEGFSSQRGLVRIILARSFGTAEQIEGSVQLTKQTYNLGLISSSALSAASIEFDMELIASAN